MIKKILYIEIVTKIEIFERDNPTAKKKRSREKIGNIRVICVGVIGFEIAGAEIQNFDLKLNFRRGTWFFIFQIKFWLFITLLLRHIFDWQKFIDKNSLKNID